MCIIQDQGGVRRRSDSCDLGQEILNLNTLITLYQPQTLEVSFIDPLQLTSSIREYGKGHQHGGYLVFLELAA